MKTLEDFKKYCGSMMESAGSACNESWGTQGCDEANFMQNVLKEIEEFEKEEV